MRGAGELVPPLADSTLALDSIRVDSGSSATVSHPEHDALLFVVRGTGSLAISGDGDGSTLTAGAAGFVLAGEEGRLEAAGDGLELICATIGSDADRHAPIGARESVTRLDDVDAERATGARSFQILFGPHNGSTRATLFAGYIPPGKAPWHYHLYDEIVWVPTGPGRLHSGDTTEELGPGSVFRLRPRQIHIVENLSSDETMTVIGIFTPAGSPSAAYLMPDVAAEYRFAG